jgi:hypothetical protein
MPSLVDNQGQRWSYEIDFPSVRRVQRMLGVDLVSLAPEAVLQKLGSPVALIDILYCLCHPDVEAAGLSDEQFGKRCVIDLQPVVDDLIGELADFFLSLGKTQHSTTMRRIWQTSQMVSGMTSQQLGLVFAEMEKSIKQIAESNLSGEPSTETPESLASVA